MQFSVYYYVISDEYVHVLKRIDLKPLRPTQLLTSIATHSHPPGHCSGTRPGPPGSQTPMGSQISHCKHRCSLVFWNNTQALATKPWVKILHKFFKLLLTIYFY